jgi:small-conductance mechanosensitive channel
VLFALVLALGLRRVRQHVLPGAADDTRLAAAARVLERPFSIGLLLALLATPWMQPLAPQRFTQLMLLIALVPVARVLVHASERTNRAVFVGLLLLLVLDRIGLVVQELPAVAQSVLLVSLVVGLILGTIILRHGGLPGDPALVRRAAQLGLAGLSLALVAEIGGWARLGALFGRSVFAGALIAVYLSAAVVAIEALLALTVASSRFRRIAVVAGDVSVAHDRAMWIPRIAAACVWTYLVLRNAGLHETALALLHAILNSGVTVGALSLTVGSVLAFGLTIFAAPFLVRWVTSILEREIYPRTSLPRGVPYALSMLVRYVVYAMAFVAALASAGVRLSEISIVLGGLGVGVGLGLQDLVKNFASGLVLLFERRVYVGDALELPGQEIFGRVVSIGMRATVVRNWDGAEVVLPNANLVSGAVTNWTLSDRLRRLEIPVGVAYGTEPQTVIDLLLEIARAHDNTLDTPPPQALFKGFGQSSLDFVMRVWTDVEFERTLPLQSELALEVNRNLIAAGITIPFPQRDLHLSTISPTARDALVTRVTRVGPT